MIIIRNNLIPVKGYCAMTVWPFIFVRKGYALSENVLLHEQIHGRQQLEMLVVPFFLWYFVEWLCRRAFGSGNAYFNISFEQESYDNEFTPDYLEHRRLWAWTKYL